MPMYDDQRYVSEDDSDPYRGRQYPISNPTTYGRYERYECEAPTLKARQDDMKGKKVTFCMSGDKDCKGVDICINTKIRTFQSLLSELERHTKIKPKRGIRCVFRKDGGRFRKVEDLNDIQSGDLCVVSDKQTIDTSIDYGNPSGPSPTKLQRSPVPRRSQRGTGQLRRSVQSRKKDAIVILNKEREWTYKLNPSVKQNFEECLCDMGEMLQLSAYGPLQMHCVTSGKFEKIDSISKLNSQLHAIELRSSGRETPKFVICKNGERPEDALSAKLKRAYQKKGLIKSPDNKPDEDNRYGDDDDENVDEQDGAPEPEKHTRRQPRSRGLHNSPSPTRQNEEHKISRRGVQKYRREASPQRQIEEPPLTSRRPTERSNGMTKSQSRDSVYPKQNSNRTPRQSEPPSRPSQRNQQINRRRVEQEDSSQESQNNQEESDSDSDSYPSPREPEPRKFREPIHTPDY